ncbi:GNAT family N-acetyltransferase [Actinophytocola sediminis]
MDVQVYDEPAKFRAAIGDLYTADPVRHTLAVTVSQRFLDDPAITPVMLTVHRDGVLHGAAFRTAPWPLVISGLPPDAADPAAELLAEHDPTLAGVNGPRASATAFADAWVRYTGDAQREVIGGLLYRLEELLPPEVPGGARVATEADVPLLVRWRRDFQVESRGHDRHLERSEELIRRGLAIGDGVVIWEHDGQPVSWANVSRPVADMCRVGPVYTPPAHRGHGFGSAATSAASQWAFDAGARHVVLFTDLANPTVNSIYPKIGYRPVSETAEIEFTATA